MLIILKYIKLILRNRKEHMLYGIMIMGFIRKGHSKNFSMIVARLSVIMDWKRISENRVGKRQMYLYMFLSVFLFRPKFIWNCLGQALWVFAQAQFVLKSKMTYLTSYNNLKHSGITEQRNLFFRSIFLKIINCFVTAVDHQCSQTLFCLCSGSE